ncbi:DUF3558 family protein [Actinopolyspora mortivallis]|uniref:DUF3558 domain-containing protein n=1 Tax=Actinopolyspora mortivallis TaxID=33906 RepID=A0A2T0GVV5_ACTMO|nr:DUF3558 family protein [Actinopolyspora mortivallis]PRW63232.1 hypothetical protein CEP50_11140 [Actinopolyspora mortivallis]
MIPHTPASTLRRIAATAATATCAILATSCTTETTQPHDQNPQTTQTNSTPLATIEPCSTLTDQQKTQLNITKPGKISKLDDQTCTWMSDGSNFDISVYKDMSLHEINFSESEEKTKTQVNGREALLAKNNTGSAACSLAFAVSEHSSVSVNSIADEPGDTQTACALVKKAAPMVERNIPNN